jgi:DNA-binding transcriptional ArsR family regulator
MSYRDRTDPTASGWAGLAEWTGGLPPEQIQALAAVRPFEAVHSLLRGLAGRTPRELLARAAVLEALASSETGLEEALSWLAEPARGETLRALRRSGWLEPGPEGTFALSGIGRQVWDVLRRAAFPEARSAPPLLPPGVTPEQIVRALLTRSVEELAAAGRAALIPVVPAPPLLTTEAVARAAEAQALEGLEAELGKPGGGRRK